MVLCKLCESAFDGRGYVCAPIGQIGDRCCKACNETVVLPARLETTSKSKKRLGETNKIDLFKRRRGAFAVAQSSPSCVETDVDWQTLKSTEEGVSFLQSGAGIEVDGVVVVENEVRVATVAFKPPVPSERSELFAVDVIVGCDSTLSMLGSGEFGLRQTLRNFDLLVDKSLKKHFSTSKVETVESVRRSTNVHFFKFGHLAREFKAQEDKFVSLADPDFKDMCKALSYELTFEDESTNISSAIAYASIAAKQRLQSMAADDATTGVKRSVCFVLLTDGSANSGVRDPLELVRSVDKTISDVCDMKMSIFAIGLGRCTDPYFLTRLCRGGFWKNVVDPCACFDAFELTFGTILSSVDVYDVRMRISLRRSGLAVAGSSETESRTYVGLLTHEACRARTTRVPIPTESQAGDELVIRTTFGVDGEEFESRIFLASIPNESMPVVDGSTATNMIPGLCAEADEIGNSVEQLKTRISLGEDVDSATDGILTKTLSYAVRSQIERYSSILSNNIGNGGNGGNGGGGSMSSTCINHEVSASFSQIES